MGTMDMFLWTAVNEFEKGAKTPQAALDYAVEELIMEMED
jgi:maltose-binding protein MalE